MINIVIIHPKKYERENLYNFLSDHGDFNILGLGVDAYDALKIIGSLRPDIALIDEDLGFFEAESVQAEGIFPLIKMRSPDTLLVLLAARADNNRFLRVISDNVKGIICINTDLNILPSIIDGVYKGGSYISPLLTTRILHLFSQVNQKYTKKILEKKNLEFNFPLWNDPAGIFSKTELQILLCLGKSYNNRQIANELDLAYGTVRNCISAMMHKTGLKNRLLLVKYAIEYGLVPA